MNNKDLVSFGLGTITGALLVNQNAASPSQQPDIINKSYSFPDVWQAYYSLSNGDLSEKGNLICYKFFYGYIYNKLYPILNGNVQSFDHARAIVKECFDRYQCNALGLEVYSSGTGMHTILQPSTGAVKNKITLVKINPVAGNGNFLITPLGGSDLVDEVHINVPPRNKIRQFYLKEYFTDRINKDFRIIQETGLSSIPMNDPLYLRKLGALQASIFGRSRCLESQKIVKVLELIDYVSFFSNLDGTGSFVYLKRIADIPKYKDFINSITNLIYE